VPDDDYPLLLTTGRTVHHFHTRTKTARAPELEAAAPLPWVEVHPDDAAGLGLADGDVARVTSPRGEVRVPVRVGGPRRGVVFMPFHYGYWDLGSAGPAPEGRAANELTATGWDPVSKQPLYKVTAVAVAKWG
jgi:anaerobic selenocysteine-containing dehydrogenase